MNLLTDKTPDYIFVGGFKLKIKTDFVLWVKFISTMEKKETKEAENLLFEIFDKIPNEINEMDLLNAILDWLWRCEEKITISENKTNSSKSFDFIADGNIIYCELWEYFPHLMQKGITFQEGIELIKLLLNNEKTILHHRAFARCGDFSKMSKEEKKYWQKERAKYAFKIKQEDFDNILSNAFF